MDGKESISNFAFLTKTLKMKKVIPPMLFILCIGLMIGLNLLNPKPKLITPPLNYLGILPIILGLVVQVLNN